MHPAKQSPSRYRSLKTRFMMMRFTVNSLLSFLLDSTIFIVLQTVGTSVFSSLLVARICSGLFNFLNNKLVVYRSFGLRRMTYEILGYLMLAVGIFLSALYLIHGFHSFGIPIIMAKILADIFLFSLSFFVQKTFVFSSKIE